MADNAEAARKAVEAKLKAIKKLDTSKIDAVIKEAKVLKGDKDMPD